MTLAYLHLMKAIVCLLEEFLQPLKLARLQVCLICVLISNERASKIKITTQHNQDIP